MPSVFRIFKKLLQKKPYRSPETLRAQTAVEPTREFPFTRRSTLGSRDPATVPVEFVDPDTGARRVIVDEKGNIQNFPGFAEQDSWLPDWSGAGDPEPCVRYETSFSPVNGRFLMKWEIQPDGRFWEDETGFGAEKDEDICLYALIDSKGEFEGPFRVFSIGAHCFVDPAQM